VYVSGRPGTLAHGPKALLTLWRQHLEQIETFIWLCHTLVQKLLICLGLAMNASDYEALAKDHDENTEGTVQFRIRRHAAQAIEARRADSTVWLPSSSTGSIIIGFMAEGLVEVDTANGDWSLAPGAKDGILVYLEVAIPYWSRGHLQKMRYRLAWTKEAAQTEKINMTYLSATARSYDSNLGGKQARVEKT